MPSINRIRVNNINYNDGTQRYDDFTMSFYGKNGLYDLVNGGGKSILLMMIMQTVLPNQELDKKQPVSKLFKGSNNNTAIHSMVEWKLDKSNREFFRAKYLLAGFCAKKGSDNQGDIEYFNYAITYSTYHDYDIVNFPLEDGKEKIGYSGLRKKLRTLKEMDLINCKVHIFETNESYKRFLSQFGIYESHWNILKGINVSEGRVRTYIEENYRTTRKLVDKLLIEEIIEKANGVRRENSDTGKELTQSLFDIESKMIELSSKKKEIEVYRYQIQSLDKFIHKLDEHSKNLLDEESYWIELNKIYQELVYNKDNIEKQIKYTEEELSEIIAKTDENRKYKDEVKIRHEWQFRESRYELLKSSNFELEEKRNELDKVRNELQIMEAMKYYRQYMDDSKKLRQIKSELDNKDDKQDVKLSKIHQLTYSMKEFIHCEKTKCENIISNVEKELREIESGIRRGKEEYSSLLEKVSKLSTLAEVEAVSLSSLNDEMEYLNQSINRIHLELDEIVSILSDEELLEYYKKQIIRVKAKILEEESNKKQLEEEYIQLQIEEKVLLEASKHISSNIQQKLEEKSRMDGVLEKILRLKQIHHLDIECSLDYIQSYIGSKESDEVKANFIKKQELNRIEQQLSALEENKMMINNEELIKIYHYLKEMSSEVELASDYISRMDTIQRKELLNRIPYTPYGIIVSDKMYTEIKKNIRFDWLNVTSLVPLISESQIDKKEIEQDDVTFIQNDMALYFDERYREREILQLKLLKEKLEKEIIITEDNMNHYKQSYELIINFKTHSDNRLSTISKEVKNLQNELDSNGRKGTNISIRYEKILNSLREMKEQIEKIGKDEVNYQTMVSKLNERLNIARLIEKVNIKVSDYRKSIKEYTLEKNSCMKKISLLEEDYNNKKNTERTVLEKLKQLDNLWESKYRKYDDGRIYSLISVSFEDIEIELDASINNYEYEHQEYKHKIDMLSMLEESMERNCSEIHSRNLDIQVLEEKSKEYSISSISNIGEHIRKKQLLESDFEKIKSNYYKIKAACDECSGKLNFLIEDYEMKYSESYSIKTNPIDSKQLLLQCEKKEEKYSIRNRRLREVSQKLYSDLDIIEKLLDKSMTYIHTMNRSDIIKVRKENNTKISFVAPAELKIIMDKMIHKLNEVKRKVESSNKRSKDSKLHCVKEINIRNQNYARELDSCLIDDNYENINQLIHNLIKSKEYFEEEINTIDQGLHEIVEIKERFKNRCLQESLQIKTDLEKFSKYSNMYIDNEMLQAVKLKIYYLPDEVQKSKMEKYIDKIVDEASKYTEDEDKKKIFHERLSSKNLFGVIVNEVNGMELYLYKRERVKENSRHLRFEEAVGSTGQSQGIYILLIISIINYIARMYSNEADDRDISKTIFIDNPFGAAKDVYIWEPILSMLKENKVQLIVPTRGVAPAMTSKFEVYYTLGQEMRGDKLQTVVSNYRSEMNLDEAEYIKIESIQMDLLSMLDN